MGRVYRAVAVSTINFIQPARHGIRICHQMASINVPFVHVTQRHWKLIGHATNAQNYTATEVLHSNRKKDRVA